MIAPQPIKGEPHPGIIVVVDDEPVVLRAFTRHLERTPFKIVPCLTPHEAIDQVAQGHVSVVVSDISM